MFKDFFENRSINNMKEKDSYIKESNESEKDNILSNIRKEVKIKDIIPTRFGIEIILFNSADARKAAEIAKTEDIEGNSIFVKI
jgi:hypothetical protein